MFCGPRNNLHCNALFDKFKHPNKKKKKIASDLFDHLSADQLFLLVSHTLLSERQVQKFVVPRQSIFNLVHSPFIQRSMQRAVLLFYYDEYIRLVVLPQTTLDKKVEKYTAEKSIGIKYADK